MTLLNASAFFAALGLLVPIVIHLHRKRKARIVEWPAMQFLTNTMASRRRGLSLENLLLLFVRCLVILLFALAMAQPLLPSAGSLPLVASFVMMTGGLMGLVAGMIRSLTLRIRIAGIVAAVVLLTATAVTLQLDPDDFTSPTENCDLVIVLDETSSMLMTDQTAEDQQQSAFAHSVDQAMMLVDQLSGSSTVIIMRCGPVIETIDGSPFRDLPAARKLLVEIQATGGGANTNDAIERAIELAKRGPNSRKQVVLFTDDQLKTWESFEETRSFQISADNTLHENVPEDVAQAEKSAESRVHLAVHLAKLPQHAANVSVVGVRVESPVPAVGQPLMIEADVRNHGASAVGNPNVQLSVDGKPVTVENIDVLSPATTITIRFRYTFQRAGEHVVTVQTEFPDVMMDDNRYDTVVSVVPFVSVLLVNGNEFAKPGDQSATFLQLSLDPSSRAAVDQKQSVTGRPIHVDAVNVAELSLKDSISNYDVIVLSEVPLLPSEVAMQIANYVRDGGGLWVIPDQQANVTFYNDWKTEDAKFAVLPATLMDYQQPATPDKNANAGQTGIDLQTIPSGFVTDLIKTGEHDLTEVVVSGYRQATLNDPAVAAMELTNGDPLFVEHSVGQGRVLLQTVALGRQESNLPQRVCFP
ncbi:MAG: BatA domain-containing protein, partial [Fuerstiella sp.]